MKKKVTQKNDTEYYEVLRLLASAKKEYASKNYGIYKKAYDEIVRYIGEPSARSPKSEYPRFSYDKAVNFLKKRYKAKEVPFTESLDYFQKNYDLDDPEKARKTGNPSYVTDGWWGPCDFRSFLIPLHDTDSFYRDKYAEACVLLLKREDNLVQNWWLSKNSIDSSLILIEQQLYIFKSPDYYKVFLK